MTDTGVRVMRLRHGKGIALPQRRTPGAAGFDLAAAVTEPVLITPGEHETIPTGFIFALPEGTEGQVRPRSGLAAEWGVTVLNAPGTIDSDYRGEVKVVLINLGRRPFMVMRGLRIAQLVVAPVLAPAMTEVTDLEGTWRGHGGFGSTGFAD